MFQKLVRATRRMLDGAAWSNTSAENSIEFSLENMEQRLLLAGNVVVRDLAGSLNITGDDLGNSITVAETLNDRYVITPLAGTTINGSTGAYTTRAYELEPGLVIAMKGGDDSVNLGPLSDMRSIRADLGSGDDTLIGNLIETRGSMSFLGGDGGDSITLNGAESHGRFAINLGTGNDAFTGINVDGTLGNIIAGAGDDIIELNDADFIAFRFAGNDGADQLIYSGLQSETTGVSNVNLGGGNDQLVLQNIEAAVLIVNAGPGDDTVTAASGINQVSVRAAFFGGPEANDSIDLSALSSPGNPVVIGFENSIIV